ncbi:FtsK/SpoIIIE domain-containing protein [Brevibacillus massiliensis]|uniref:FtsK/SpoIIIE domain-containing protein n=1 Tax=Brevibacillus massiliensis TaxID=1118054 RepID=UPI0002E5D1F7|nr:FtsK/SpoIIIE domain-containing protein [Brevibacillus massiliensis]
MKFTLGKKFVSAFVIIALLLGAVGLTCLYFLQKVDHSYTDVLVRREHILTNLNNTSDGTVQMMNSVRSYLAGANKQDAIKFEGSYQQVEVLLGETVPHLVIVIDEFAQLKKDQPEFMNELISIATIGRTLGVHLILATQKPGGVVDDKIWSNSRFRICLRVQDDADSREMLKIPDAAWITTPGRGYLQVGSNEEFELVQYAWSGAPYQPDESAEVHQVDIVEVALNGQRRKKRIAGLEQRLAKQSHSQKQLQVLMAYLKETARQEGLVRLPGPWLPPLPEQLFLEDIRGASGWNGCEWEPADTWLQPVVGLADDLAGQRQEPLMLPLEEGHLPVYGMPGTGKTTFVQTLLVSLALQHSPEDVHFYILDFGRMLRDLARLPHVGAVILDEESDKVKRLFRFLLQELDARRERIASAGAKTLTAYRRATGEAVPAIVVCIDGYLNFRNSFETENSQLEQLLREGGSVGIYFVVTANRITDIFDRVRSSFALGVSFELADPSDYYFAVGRPAKPPVNLPEGRALIKGCVPPLEFQTALPTKGADETQRTNELRDLVRRMDEAWLGVRPKEIRSLPETVLLEELLRQPRTGSGEQAGRRLKVPVGIDADDLTLFEIDLAEGPYFLVGSPIEGGKTSFLLTWLLALSYQLSPRQLEVYAIDFRGSEKGLSAVRDLPHVRGYAGDETELAGVLQQLSEQISQRAKTGPAKVHSSDDPAIFLVIDDADLFYKRVSDFQLKDQLTAILRQGRNRNFYAAISGVPADFPFSSNDWLAEVKGAQTGFLFGTLDGNDLAFLKIPSSEANAYPGAAYHKVLPPGQGYFAKRRYVRIKAALPFSAELTSAVWSKSLTARWVTSSQKEVQIAPDASPG